MASQSHTRVASARSNSRAVDLELGVRGALALGRREMLLWLAIALLGVQLFAISAGSLEAYLAGLQGHLASKNIFTYVAWFAVLSLLADSARQAPGRASDAVLVLAVIASGLLTTRSAPWLAMTASAAYLMVRDRTDIKLNAAGAVMLALAFNGFWGPRFFESFAYYLLQADAALVGAALNASRTGIQWSETIVGASSEHSIIVYGPCSSFHNISLGLLCWVALTKLARPHWVRSDIWVGVAVVLTVIALNASRLYLMALDAENYAYWHTGTGQLIFAWATTLSVLAISLYGALCVGRAR